MTAAAKMEREDRVSHQFITHAGRTRSMSPEVSGSPFSLHVTEDSDLS